MVDVCVGGGRGGGGGIVGLGVGVVAVVMLFQCFFIALFNGGARRADLAK